MALSKSKFNRIQNGISLAVLLAISSNTSAQPIPGNCKALVEMQNDLWFMKLNNSSPFQLTHDGKTKNTIGGVSPDGKMIAYLDETSANIVLMDITGQVLSKTNMQVQGGVTGLKWLNSNLLQASEHLSPQSSSFHFVEVPTGGSHPVALRGLPTAKGSSCVPSPNFRNMACILGEDGINLNGNDQDIYSTTDSFVAATELQALDISDGSAATTSTTPSFKIEVLGIVDHQVDLKVTVAADYSQEAYLHPNDTMSVSVDSDSSGDATSTVYGFTPVIKQIGHERSEEKDMSKEVADKKATVITVRVKKSVTGKYTLEDSLAWSPNGRRIAAVEKNDLGQRKLILLDTKAFAGERGDREDEHDASGNIDAKELLPISGPISRLEFTSDTHIRVEGETQVFEQNIPAFGKLRDSTGNTITPALPKQFSIGDLFLPIYGWVCQ